MADTTSGDEVRLTSPAGVQMVVLSAFVLLLYSDLQSFGCPFYSIPQGDPLDSKCIGFSFGHPSVTGYLALHPQLYLWFEPPMVLT
jgi:hypothetical protein